MWKSGVYLILLLINITFWLIIGLHYYHTILCRRTIINSYYLQNILDFILFIDAGRKKIIHY